MSFRELRLLAPAKINLSLRILGRRPDGYHFLDSAILPVSLYDQVTLRVHWHQPAAVGGPFITVVSDDGAAPGGPANLAYRAAELFSRVIDQPLAAQIYLRKRIPVGSGLGGGSSDAAAVLRALNRLCGTPCDADQLAGIGAQLGADVPVFVYGRPARVQGIGDQVTPLASLAPLNVLVCWDGQALSTKAVYSRVDLTLTSGLPASNIASFVSGHVPIAELLVNDLEAAAAQLHPGVLVLKDRVLELGAQGALMTGSGSAVFGIFRDRSSALDAAERLRALGLWAAAAQTLVATPAH